MEKFREKFAVWYANNSGMFWGIVIGLAIAILFLTIGFFPTLLIMLCVGVGAYLGTHPEVREAISSFFIGLFSGKRKQ